MKRVLCIVYLLGVVTCPLRSQVSSLYGEFRYQHQYQDALSYGSFYKLNRKNPQLILGTNGYILSPAILSVGVRSSLNINYNNATFGGVSSSFRQYLFNYYDTNIDFLQRFPVRLNFSASDFEVETESNMSRYGKQFSNQRQQQQRLTISTYNINFLPVTVFSYLRIHNWSALPYSPLDQFQNELSITMNQATPNGAFNLTGTMSDNRDRITGIQYTYHRLQMNGNREFSREHRIDLSGEYHKFEKSTTIAGSGIYNGMFGEKLRTTTTILARNGSSQSSASTTLGMSETIQFLQDDNFHYSLNVQNQSTSDASVAGAEKFKSSTTLWSGSASIQHMRTVGSVNFSNNVVAGAGQQRSTVEQRSFSLGLTNALQAPALGFQATANQGITMNRLLGYLQRDELSNFINVILSRVFPYAINSQTGVEFRDNRRFRTVELPYRYQVVTLSQIASSSLHMYMPITVTIGGNLSWIRNGVRGRTYSMNLNLSSSDFVIQHLMMSYRLNRTYDIYYRRPYLEHTLEFGYSWRALQFQVRLQEFRFVDIRHDLWFTVSRPFNVGL